MTTMTVHDSLLNLNQVSVLFSSLLKVLRKWYEDSKQSSGRIMHLLLSDVDGNRVEACVDDYLFPCFDKLIVVGGIYCVHRFSTIDQKHFFPPSSIPYMIMFFKSTNVQSVSSTEFPYSLFRFTSFSVMRSLSDVEHTSYLVDVIGGGVDIRYEIISEEGKGSMILLLEDDEQS